jgi:hypothetical protein
MTKHPGKRHVVGDEKISDTVLAVQFLGGSDHGGLNGYIQHGVYLSFSPFQGSLLSLVRFPPAYFFPLIR